MCSPATTFAAFGPKRVDDNLFSDTDNGTGLLQVVSGLNVSTGSGITHSGGPATITSIDAHLSVQDGPVGSSWIDVLSFSRFIQVAWSDQTIQLVFGAFPDGNAFNGSESAGSSGGIYSGATNLGWTLLGTYSFSNQDLQITLSPGISDTEVVGSILEGVYFQNILNFRLGFTETVSWSFGTSSGTATAASTQISVAQHIPQPPTLGINLIAGDNTINKAEANAVGGVTIGGFTSNDGNGLLDLRITDSNNHLVYVDSPFSSGSWSSTLSKSVLLSLADGTYTLQVTDPSNFGFGVNTVATKTFTLDTTSPSIAINTIAGDDVLSQTEAASPVAIGGTTSGAENGRTVTVKVLDSASHVQDTLTTSVTGGVWSVNLSVAQMQALASGSDTVTADVSDAAGNAAVTAVHPLSFAPPPTVVTESATVASGGRVAGTAGIAGTGALAGDSDASGYDLAVSAVTGGALDAPVHGIYGDLTLHADGSFSYEANATPSESANIAAAAGPITDSFTFSVSDGHGGVSLSTLTVNLDATRPTITAVGFSPAGGPLGPLSNVTITLTTSDTVVLDTSGGSPTLTLNDGGVATFDAVNSTTTSLVFDYTVAAGDNTVASLAATGFDLNGALVRNASDVADVSLSFAGLAQAGPPINTTGAAGAFVWAPDPASGLAERFEVGQNWLGGSAPGAHDTAIFGNVTVNTVFMEGFFQSGPESVDSLQFTADAPAYAFSWNVGSLLPSTTQQVLMLGSNGGQDIDNESPNTVSFVVAAAPATVIATPELFFEGAGIKGPADLTVQHGAVVGFFHASTAGDAKITALGGAVSFEDTSTAGDARLIAETIPDQHGGTYVGQFAFDAAVASAGSIEGDGNFIINGELTVGSNGLSTAVSGALSGAGALIKTGDDTLTLSGNNSFSGTTTVNGGVLEVDGSLANSAVTVNGGVLDGSGTTGAITVASGGTLAPGAGIGTLYAGDVAFAAGAHFSVALGGVPPGQSDELDVTGAVSLGGASLDLTLAGYTPHVGDSFVIIRNDGADAVTGQFAQGTTFLSGGKTYAIDYAGGDGNDVVLTVSDTPPTIGGDHAIALASGATVTVTTTDLTATDPDNTDAEITYTLAVAAHGTVLFSGAALAVGQAFTQADLAAGHVSFHQDGSSGTEAGFTVSVSDGFATPQFATISAAVPRVEHTPVAQNGSANGSENGIIFATLGATDADGDALTYALVGDPTHGSVTVLANGAFLYTPATNYFGPDSFTFTASDSTSDSNVATESLTLAAVNDAPPPAAPVLANDTGTAGDTITSDATIIYPAPAAGDVLLYSLDGINFTTTAPAFSTDGSYTLSIKERDTAGNTSSAASLTFTRDTTAPAAASAPALTAASDSGKSQTDGITNVTTPSFTGTAEAGALVTLFDGATMIGSRLADSHGDWSITSTLLAEGAHSITATATDPAGNVGVASAATSVTIDTTLPAAPIVKLAHDMGTSSSDNLTNDATLTVLASSPSFQTDGGGTTSAQPVFAMDGSADGTHTVTVTDVDTAGNTVSTSLTFTLDTQPPIASNGGGSGNAGSAIAGGLSASDHLGLPLSYSVVSGPAHGSVTIGLSGNYSYTSDAAFTGTDSFTFTANDGVLSSNVAAISLNISDPHLTGSGGNDTYMAPSGSEHIDAGGGIDSITFNFKLTDATISFVGNQVIVDRPNGSSHTVLTGVDVYNFTDGTVNENDGDPLVDDLFYYSRNPDLWKAGLDADAHYHAVGWHEGLDPDPFFSTSTYLSLNPAVRAAGVDPLVQFDHGGWRTSDPSISFDVNAYLNANPDVRAAGIDPLSHFLQYGEGDLRMPAAPTTLVASNGFDYVYYLQHNPDVAAAHIDPFLHYETVGWKEGRNPNAYFDVNGYLAHNPDVAAAGINPLDHYDQSGWKEGRDPSPNFDTKAYLAAYPDVAAAHIDPLLQFLQHGVYEGRTPHGDGVWN